MEQPKRKRKQTNLHKDDGEEITNELYMPFDKAMNKIAWVKKDSLPSNTTPFKGKRR